MKKHLSDEPGESARRGEPSKSKILAGGDKRAKGLTCKTQFYKWLRKEEMNMKTQTRSALAGIIFSSGYICV
jgi:hypothetical protein